MSVSQEQKVSLRAVRAALWEHDPHCSYCRRRLPMRLATVDHVVPRAAGGSDDISNLRIACKNCNTHKHHLPLSQWLECLERMTESVRAIVEG